MKLLYTMLYYQSNPDLKVGEKIYEELPQIDFGEIAAQGKTSNK